MNLETAKNFKYTYKNVVEFPSIIPPPFIPAGEEKGEKGKKKVLYDLKREISAEARRLRNGRKKREKVDEPGFPELSEAKKKGREEICDSFSSGKVGLNHSSANLSPASL